MGTKQKACFLVQLIICQDVEAGEMDGEEQAVLKSRLTSSAVTVSMLFVRPRGHWRRHMRHANKTKSIFSRPFDNLSGRGSWGDGRRRAVV